MSPIAALLARRCIACLLSLSICVPAGAAPIAGPQIQNCPLGGYSIYYVNGINNDYQDAVISATSLATLTLPKAVDASIQGSMEIHTIYNPTEDVKSDLLEAIGQIGTGIVSNVTAYFTAAWAGVFGGLVLPIPGLDGVLTKFLETFRSSVTKALSPSAVQKVVGDNAPRIVADLNGGRVVVIVAHSQGNLFANEIYDAVSLRVPPEKMAMLKVVNVAAPTLRHISNLNVLNSTDHLISLSLLDVVPLFGNPTFTGSTVKDYLSPLLFNKAVFQDEWGHNFVSVYLSTVPGTNGTTLQDQVVQTLQQAFTEALASAVESCPRPLSCKLNADGTGTLTGSYPVNLQPGQNIKLRAWPGRNLTGFIQPGASKEQCSQGNYVDPGPGEPPLPSADLNFGFCTPTTGLQTRLDYGTICYNPIIGGMPRNINVIFNGTISSAVLYRTNTFDFNYCQLTEGYLNSEVASSGFNEDVITHTLVSCK